MNTLTVFVPGTPQPWPKVQTVSGVTKTGKRYTNVFHRDSGGDKRAWRDNIMSVVSTTMRERSVGVIGMDSWVNLRLFFYINRPKSAPNRIFPNVRPDLDNLAYAVANCLKGVLFHDDCQICGLTAIKGYNTAVNGVNIKECGLRIDATWGINEKR